MSKTTRKALTEPYIEKAECPDGVVQAFFWDSVAPGLALRVTPSGSRAYVFQSRVNGKVLRVTIGNCESWRLGEARKEARRLQTLCDTGNDPRTVKAAKRVASEAAAELSKAKAASVADAWAAYIEHHRSRWGARHLADHLNLSQEGGQPKKRGKGLTKAGVLAPVLAWRMSEVTADRLKAWQADEAAERANNARQGFELFRAFWRWCATRPEYRAVVDLDAVESRDLRAEVPSRQTKRFDVLERAQLEPWFAAVRSLGNPVISAYLQALLLTGARREELAELKWADVDFQWQAMWIKDKVEEAGRKIPLTPYVASLLQGLPRRNEWVFSSPTAEAGRIAEPRLPHNRALDVAGLPHVTLHGLRRTFKSMAEWVEMPVGVTAQIMGHKPNATAEKHYTHRPLELLAIWHGKYEAWLLDQAGVAWASPVATGAVLRVVGGA